MAIRNAQSEILETKRKETTHTPKKCKICGKEFIPRNARDVGSSRRVVCYEPRCERAADQQRRRKAYLKKKAKTALLMTVLTVLTLLTMFVCGCVTTRAQSRSCCRMCRVGQPCGDSCISIYKICSVPTGCACGITE